MAQPRFAFIVNPRAGRGRGLAAWRFVEREMKRLRIPCETAMTEGPGHAEALARQWAGRAKTVVAIGGDGTLHEVGNGLLDAGVSGAGPTSGIKPGDAQPPGRSVELGWIPAGSGNDLARTLGMPRNPRRAVAVLLSGERRTVDAGRVNDRLFFNVAGVGFDARVAEAVSRMPAYTRGTLSYVLAALKLLPSLKNPEVEVCAGEMRMLLRSLLIAVGIGRYYGGGMKICPRADAADGLFDVCIAGDLGRLEVLGALVKAFRGDHLRMAKVRYHTAPSLVIEGPPEVLVQADGQLVGRLPASFEILPGALTVIASRGGDG